MAKGSKPANPGKGQAKLVAGKSDGGKARGFAPFMASAKGQTKRQESAEKGRVRQAKQQGKK